MLHEENVQRKINNTFKYFFHMLHEENVDTNLCLKNSVKNKWLGKN